MKLVLSEAAEADLESILLYIAADDVDAALRHVAELRRRMEILKDSPRAGRIGIEPGTFELVIKPYVMPYTIHGDVVEIVRVWRGSQRFWG